MGVEKKIIKNVAKKSIIMFEGALFNTQFFFFKIKMHVDCKVIHSENYLFFYNVNVFMC